MSSFGGSPTGAAGYPISSSFDAKSAPEARSTPLVRLESALNRLGITTSDSIGIAVRLTGGWPMQANSLSKDAPAPSGFFGEIEIMADVIHRICDNLNEANSAITSRLP